MWTRKFTNCFSCVWNYITWRSLFAFFHITCVINLLCMFPLVTGTSCSDTEMLKKEAVACFRSYGTQKTYVDRSEQRLFSGIDIETLRAYCSSYLEAIQCVSKLVTGCPSSAQSQVEEALVSYNGIQEELTDLCRTQNLYELYAQYMTCYAERGQKSDWCFESKLNNSMLSIYKLPSPEFCGRIQEATYCIQNNIRQECGEKAAELVHLLVKPTVFGSSHCKYDVQENTPQTMKTDGGGKNNPQNEKATSSQSKNGHSSAILHLPDIFCIFASLYMSFIAYSFKSRGLS